MNRDRKHRCTVREKKPTQYKTAEHRWIGGTNSSPESDISEL